MVSVLRLWRYTGGGKEGFFVKCLVTLLSPNLTTSPTPPMPSVRSFPSPMILSIPSCPSGQRLMVCFQNCCASFSQLPHNLIAISEFWVPPPAKYSALSITTGGRQGVKSTNNTCRQLRLIFWVFINEAFVCIARHWNYRSPTANSIKPFRS